MSVKMFCDVQRKIQMNPTAPPLSRPQEKGKACWTRGNLNVCVHAFVCVSVHVCELLYMWTLIFLWTTSAFVNTCSGSPLQIYESAWNGNRNCLFFSLSNNRKWTQIKFAKDISLIFFLLDSTEIKLRENLAESPVNLLIL